MIRLTIIICLLVTAQAWAGFKMYAPGQEKPIMVYDGPDKTSYQQQPQNQAQSTRQVRSQEQDDTDMSGVEWRQSRGLYSGRSSQGTKPFGYRAGSYRLEYKYRGGTNFIVWLHSRRGLQKLMVNVISSRKGSSCVRLNQDDEIWFEVDTGGNWEFTFERTGS